VAIDNDFSIFNGCVDEARTMEKSIVAKDGNCKISVLISRCKNNEEVTVTNVFAFGFHDGRLD